MNAQDAERLLSCHQPGHEPGAKGDRINKAVRLAGRDERLKQKLAAQESFDQTLVGQIERMEVPEHLAQTLAALEAAPTRDLLKAPWKNPAVLAALLSLTIIAALLIRGALERSADFPGKEVARQMVHEAQTMSGVEFEPIKPTELGRLDDWFAMHGVDRFVTPPEFEKMTAVGARVQRQTGFRVAQALVEKNNMIIYVFRGSDLGIRLNPPARWRTFAEEDWAGAIRAMDDLCIMLAFRGTEDQMKQFLATEGK